MLTSLLLVCAVGADPSGPLTGADLIEMNRGFAEAHRIDDNEFLYREKLAEALGPAREAEGRKVRLVAEVRRVSTAWVDVTFFPGADDPSSNDVSVAPGPTTSKPLLPQVRFTKDEGRAGEDSDSSSGLGFTTAGYRFGRLKVGGFVPVEMARTLRRKDRIAVSGVVAAVETAKVAGSDPRGLEVARFVVAGALKVEKVAAEEAEREEAGSP